MKTINFLIALTLSLIFMYLAIKSRGYFAIGGEVFIPILVIAFHVYKRTKNNSR